MPARQKSRTSRQGAARRTGRRSKSTFSLSLLGRQKVLSFLVIAVFAVVGVVALSGSFAATNWKVYWQDDFSGTSVDTKRWKPYYNDYGVGNNEYQCHTPNNASVSNGTIKITTKKETVDCPKGSGTIRKEYTSAFLGSRETGTYYPLYGKYEMRARVPHGQGLWPGFWLRHRSGSSTAEVDVVELFHNQAPGKVTQTLHFPNSIGRNIAKKSTSFESAVNGTGGWHTFGVEIVPADNNAIKFTFLVDGTQTLSYTNTQTSSWIDSVDKNAAWDIAFNVSAGGTYVGDPLKNLGYLPDINKCSLTYSAPTNGASSCPTTGIHLANLPSIMEVDWIRVSVPDSTTTTPSPTPAPTPTPTPTPAPEPTGEIPTPTNFRGEAGSSAVTLSWDKSPDSRVDVYSMRYIRSDSNEKSDGSKWTYPGRTSATQMTLDNSTFEAGTSYDFQIRAIDDKGTSSSSDDTYSSYTGTLVVSPRIAVTPADTTPPSTPTALTRTLNFDWAQFKYVLNVKWQPSTDNASGVSGYSVTRNNVLLGFTTRPEINDSNLAAGANYTYEVRAFDGAKNTSAPASISAATQCYFIWCSLK